MATYTYGTEHTGKKCFFPTKKKQTTKNKKQQELTAALVVDLGSPGPKIPRNRRAHVLKKRLSQAGNRFQVDDITRNLEMNRWALGIWPQNKTNQIIDWTIAPFDLVRNNCKMCFSDSMLVWTLELRQFYHVFFDNRRGFTHWTMAPLALSTNSSASALLSL